MTAAPRLLCTVETLGQVPSCWIGENFAAMVFAEELLLIPVVISLVVDFHCITHCNYRESIDGV